MIARFALSAWIGAAALFVCTSISEQIAPTFDSDMKNTLAAIRFPWYYGFGFGLVGIGFVGSVIGVPRAEQRHRWAVIVTSLVLALTLMAVDYVLIYKPLHEIVTSPTSVRDARFVELHRWSERINSIDIMLCLIAALAVCWPTKTNTDH
ncbi:MAG: hypothetical protein IAG10_34305 [Planctomycetaceae bacterium]|nr:hypothetical protein [Planctomycetaceae bacterium]